MDPMQRLALEISYEGFENGILVLTAVCEIPHANQRSRISDAETIEKQNSCLQRCDDS